MDHHCAAWALWTLLMVSKPILYMNYQYLPLYLSKKCFRNSSAIWKYFVMMWQLYWFHFSGTNWLPFCRKCIVGLNLEVANIATFHYSRIMENESVFLCKSCDGLPLFCCSCWASDKKDSGLSRSVGIYEGEPKWTLYLQWMITISELSLWLILSSWDSNYWILYCITWNTCLLHIILEISVPKACFDTVRKGLAIYEWSCFPLSAFRFKGMYHGTQMSPRLYSCMSCRDR